MIEQKGDSTAGRIRGLLDSGATAPDELHWSLTSQMAKIVLTAHPTQVNQRTLLNKHGRVQRILDGANGLRLSGMPYKRRLLNDALRHEIRSIW